MPDKKNIEEEPNNEPSPQNEKKSKKEKTSKNEESIPLMLMIGGAVGGVVLIIVSVIIGTIIANKLFPPIPPVIVTASEQTENQNSNKLKPFPADDSIEASIPLLEDGQWYVFDSCRMQTNVKNNPNRLCIIIIAATYKPHYVELLTQKGFLIPEKGKDNNGKPLPPSINKTSDHYKELERNIRSAMLDFIAQHTEEELLTLRGNGQLNDELKIVLKKPFEDNGLFLKKVDIIDIFITKI